MSKKPSIALPVRPATPDAFVAAGQPEQVLSASREKSKRLTIDVPPALHQSFKLASVRQGRDMREVMIDLIERYVQADR